VGRLKRGKIRKSKAVGRRGKLPSATEGKQPGGGPQIRRTGPGRGKGNQTGEKSSYWTLKGCVGYTTYSGGRTGKSVDFTLCNHKCKKKRGIEGGENARRGRRWEGKKKRLNKLVLMGRVQRGGGGDWWGKTSWEKSSLGAAGGGGVFFWWQGKGQKGGKVEVKGEGHRKRKKWEFRHWDCLTEKKSKKGAHELLQNGYDGELKRIAEGNGSRSFSRAKKDLVVTVKKTGNLTCRGDELCRSIREPGRKRGRG